MTSEAHILSFETQATLLLCAPLLAAKEKGEAPLSIGEFNRLVTELTKTGSSVAELLQPNGPSLIARLPLELDKEKIISLLGRGFLMSLALEKWSALGIWVLGRNDSTYPNRLKVRLGHLAPPILYGCGDTALLEAGGVAVVGSRDVDERGGSFTRQLAERCAGQDVVVISGGAKGVDQIAMRTAAEKGGRVVGVLGADLARAATSGNARDLIRDKCVTMISPFDPEAGFNVGNAMARNKVIYALADYGVVISSGEKEGGTWAGAVEQLERFKQIPILVRSGELVPSGNNALLKKGGISLPEIPEGDLRQEFASRSNNGKRPAEMLLPL